MKNAIFKFLELTIYNSDINRVNHHSYITIIHIAGNERKCLNKVTNGEKSILITGCCITRADRRYFTPIVPSHVKNLKNHSLNGAPIATLKLASSSD